MMAPAALAAFGQTLCDTYGVRVGLCDNSPDLYYPELRQACEANTCSIYGKCHTCPPDIGPVDACIERALSYARLLVFQKVYTIEDSFDFDGMMAAKADFATTQHTIAARARATYAGVFVLGAGGCNYCARCTRADDLPCRFPDRALSSLEAHAIQVSKLADLAGLKYINGANTITYFGALFFKNA